MASIHKTPRSPFFFCAFCGADGKRKFRSTKSGDRRQALRICAGWQDAALQARRHELTASQCRRVLGELLSVHLWRDAGSPHCGGLDAELALRQEGFHGESDILEV